MKNFKSFAMVCLLVLPFFGKAQCDPTVPLYVIDLSANADSTWVLYEEDALDRDGQCCSALSNENCIQFLITLHPDAAGIFFDYDGAGAFGSLNWQIDCGPEFNLKDTICATDPGPFTLTFCKPGSDNGNYTLVSVSKPTFPEDQFVPLNCVQPVEAYGVTESSITWQSISPGAPGQYDNLLTCTDCLDPIYSPDPNGPVEVEYEVCGYPVLDYCVGAFDFCDTVKFTSQDSVLIDVTPINPTFCSGGNVDLIASATGGDGNYNFIWYDGSLNEIGTGTTLNVTVAGSYTCEVRDGNYEPMYCDGFSQTVLVIETLPPNVDPGADQVLCADDPEADLTATIQYATGGIWSGGAGTYSPSTTDLSITYTPTQGEIAAGLVTLTFTSTGAGSSCVDASNDVQLFFIDTIQTDLSDIALDCFGSDQLISPTVTGGLAPFDYSWTDGTTTLDNTLGTGTHCITISDANGCQVTECLTITAPSELDLTMSSTPATTNGGSDGTATATPSGGTAPYTYLWSNLGTNQTETGLSYGIYTVTVTDDNGCTHTQSVVVNEPQCIGFSVNSSATNVLCNSDSTGTATATPVGGTSPYTYVWNDYDSQTGQTATNLPAGVYEVTVTDDNGCYSIQTASVFEPDALLNTMLHSDVTIEGGNDGSAQANITGGFGAYDYSWSTTETTSSISNLVLGWYYLTVTDDNGCTIDDSVYINEPPCNEFLIYVSTVSPLCNGDLTGEADLTITNGVGPYSIDWSTGETDVLSITGLNAQVHSVEVTDAQGCYTFLNYGVSEPSALSIGLAETPSTCTGDNNGTIDMTVNGGTYPYYSYDWSNGQTTEDLINLSPGSYTITVEDLNGCQASSSTTLIDPTVLDVTYTTQDVTCFAGTDGSIDITVTGGTPTYSYDWSNGATSEDLASIDVGGYILEITDGNFCNLGEPLTILINEPTLVIADTIIINCPVPGATTTLIDVTPNGGNGNYAISTDGGSTYGAYGTYSFSLNIDQSYDVVVMDINGCLSPTYTIDIDPAVVIDDVTFNVCYGLGDTDETITVSTSGGTPDYFISTDNGSTFGAEGVYTALLPINSAYQIVAMDSNSCLSEPFAITLPDVFDANIAVTSDFNGEDISCNGFSDGEATVTATGGTGSYTYLWSNASTNAVNTNLSATSYSVTVEDQAGCQVVANITLVEPTAVVQSYTTSTYVSGNEISCNGQFDGSIDYTISGGTGGYTFDWDNDGTGDFDDTEDLSGLGAGTYNIEAMDANGCTVSESITLTEPTALSQSYTTSAYASGDQISCNGFNDGSIDYTINGGSAGYTYAWTTVDGSGLVPTDQDQTGLTAGTYTVIATDINGCTITESITLTEPTALAQSNTLSSYPSGDNISCNGFNDGTIDYTISGGSAGYTFAWSTGDGSGLNPTDEDQSGLTAGTYDVLVTDINGCSLSMSMTLTEPTALTQSYTTSLYASGDNISCFGYNDGSIDYTINGGSGGYTYSWTTIDGSGLAPTDEDQTLITAGTYDVTATDINGCFLTETVVLTEPTTATQSYTTSVYASGDEISCNGFTDGSIDYIIAGGSSGYVFDWDNDGTGDFDDTEDLSGLSAGTYMVVVMDMNGCTITQTVTLNEPTALAQDTLLSLNPSGDNISCNGVNDGSIDYIVSGGSPGYTYDWTTLDGSGLTASDEDQSGLTAGTYDVEVTDINGCTLTLSVTLTEPTLLENTIAITSDYNGENISCYALEDGEAEITVTGGSPAYTINWDNGQSGPTAVDLGAGTYNVDVVDINGCTTNNTVTLTQPDTLDIATVIVDVSCNGGNDGSIDITPSGGTLAYTFLWSNAETTEDLNTLTAGSYSVILTDANGCIYETGEIVVDPTALDLSVIVTDASCFNFDDGAVDLTVTGGTLPYSYLWDTGEVTEDIDTLIAGSYTVTVTDGNGCFTDITGIVTEPDSLMLTGVVTNASCYNFMDGEIDIELTGGTVPYSYDWDNGETTQDINGLPNGDYAVNIVDDNGCVQFGTYTVTEPDSLIITLSSPLNFHDHNVMFFGGDDGSIDAEVIGGTLDYTYLWSNGETTEDISGLVAETAYTLNVIDGQGCMAEATIILTQPLDLELPTAFSPNNDFANDVYDIHGIEAYPDNTFKVYNRWGNIVYETVSYNNTWGGENNYGKLIPDGVYFIILNINNGEIERSNYVHIKTH